MSALGKNRAFTLVVPDGYSPQVPYPLVVVLHGGGGGAAGARSQTDLEKVAGGHALFVYPEANGGTWNLDAPTSTNGDVALFDAILLFAHNALLRRRASRLRHGLQQRRVHGEPARVQAR